VFKVNPGSLLVALQRLERAGLRCWRLATPR
jgi:DNA-binding PadR family transcriptional regulator